MRLVLLIAMLAACAEDTLEDGQYTGTVTASGCMSGVQLSIEVVAGKASFSGANTQCRANEATSDGFNYDCTINGGEAKYVCMSQGPVHQRTDVVQATIVDGSRVSGSIERSAIDYAPPNCTVTAQCHDTGTFELVLQN